MRLRAQHLTSAGRCGAKGRFFKEKAPQKPFAEVAAIPTKIYPNPSSTPPKPPLGSYPSHFRGILFACAKNPPGPSHIGKKESSLSFFPMWLGLAEKQSFSAKNDAPYSCPLEKSFCGAFFKKRPSRPQAPPDKSKFTPLKFRPHHHAR